MRRLIAFLALGMVLVGVGIAARPPQVLSAPALLASRRLPAGPRFDELRKLELAPVRGPHVLLISIDTLRSDHVGAYGYSRPTTPQIDAFAAKARVYERAYAAAPLTTPSTVSMLTGLYPYRHGVRLLWQHVGDDVLTLADHLHHAGYRTAAVVSNLLLSGPASGLHGRFDTYDDAVDEPEPNRPEIYERRAARTTDAALAALAAMPRGDVPHFLWVHYIDPHGPYTPPDDAPQDFTHAAPQRLERERITDYVRVEGLDDGLEYVDRYDEEIAYTDREIGRLLDAYAQLGFAGNAVIVITADHGERLIRETGPCFCHGFDVEEETLRVPLVIRAPKLPPGREQRPASIADVMPTVLGLVGVQIPAELDGRNLADSVAERALYAEGRDSGGSGGLRRAFIYADRKIVVQHGMSNEPRRAWIERFDEPAAAPAGVDPSDPAYLVLSTMIRQDPDPGGVPRGAAKSQRASGVVADHLDAATARKLRSLGYVH